MEQNTPDKLSDNTALKHAMDNYGYALLRYCHNILCDYHEAQDVVQTTFIKAYDKGIVHKQKAELSPWLYRCAYNLCVDILRRRKLGQSITVERQSEQDDYIPDNIKNALMTLNAIDRSVVYGRVMENMSYNELAAIHRKSPAALRKRYERAKKSLAMRLQCDYPAYANTLTNKEVSK